MKNWKLSSKEAITLPNGRQLICVEIGLNEKGEPMEEWVYEDILQDINNSLYEYKIITRVGRVPQLTILDRGKLILHNEEARNYSSEIQRELGNIPMGLLTKAFTEIRLNAERYATRNHSTNAVVCTINASVGQNLSTDFIYAVMTDFLESQFNEPITEIQESVHYADYEELIAYACDAVLHMDSKCEDEVIKHFTGNEVIMALGKELVFRLLTGEIHQR